MSENLMKKFPDQGEEASQVSLLQRRNEAPHPSSGRRRALFRGTYKGLVSQSIKDILLQKRSLIVLSVLCLVALLKVDTLALQSAQLKANYNLYDLLLFSLSNFNTVMFALSFLFLLLIGIISLDGERDVLVILRCNHRGEWFFSKVIAIVAVSFLYVFSVIAITLVVGIRVFGFHDEWSQATWRLSQDAELSLQYGNTFREELLHALTPLEAVITAAVLLLGYFICLGVVLFIVNVVTRRKIFGLLSSLLLISISVTVFKLDLIGLYKFSFHTNALLHEHDFGYDPTLPMLTGSFFFWVIFAACATVVGYLLFRRLDITHGVREL